MKKPTILFAALAACLSAPAFAATNVAQGAGVSLAGEFFTNGWCCGITGVAGSTLTDGFSFAEQTQWDQGSVWWGGSTDNSATINLGGIFNINSFSVQADNNDAYRLEYRLGGGAWTAAWDIGAVDGYGLMTRASGPLAITADALRFTATSGDSYYSVSEIQAIGAPVPEPETYAMMLAGLGMIGAMARRRRQANSAA